jgi:hypothetical protein
MKSFQAAVVIAAAAALALPASAAPPSGEIARLKHEITRLRAKVSRLTAANKRLRLDNKTLTARWNESLGRENVLSERVAESDPCPITHPNGSTPPGPTFGAAFEGNGAIWVGLWKWNVIAWQPDPDGSIGIKFGWWRAVQGKLRIEGRRMDGAAPPLAAQIPDGYGDSGFQSSEIIFPTPGCWKVTGSVGNASLTFVTLVLSA